MISNESPRALYRTVNGITTRYPLTESVVLRVGPRNELFPACVEMSAKGTINLCEPTPKKWAFKYGHAEIR